jgi:hypothetical protein
MGKNDGYIGNTNAMKYKTQEELQKGIDKYFKDCDKNEKPYTMSGLAYSLGIDRVTLINYGKRDLFFTQIKDAKSKVQAQLEENALMGKGNAVFTIFNLKNNYGWTEKQEIEANTKNKVTIINSLPKDDK